jgi:Tfx family DNA-binding protein
MVDPSATVLTERQVEVLELRAAGHTQRSIADRLGTTDSNVSAIERAAEANVEKARRTLELVRSIRAPVRFDVPAGTSFDALVDDVYERADSAGIEVSYPRPELYAHLYESLEAASDSRLDSPATIGIDEDGAVHVSGARE